MHWDETSHPLYVFEETQAHESQVQGSCIHLPPSARHRSRHWRFKTRVNLSFPSFFEWPQELRLRAWLAGGTRSGRVWTVSSRMVHEEEKGWLANPRWWETWQGAAESSRSLQWLRGRLRALDALACGGSFHKVLRWENLSFWPGGQLKERCHLPFLSWQFRASSLDFFFSPAHFLLATNELCSFQLLFL